MKSILYVLFSMCVLSSCVPVAKTTTTTTSTTTSVTEVLSPAGLWDYTITGTPEGDFAGLLTITQAGEPYTATLALRGHGLPIQNFAYAPATKKLTGELSYSGLIIAFEALMTGDELNGAMSEGGAQFPFKATRRK